MIHDSTVCIRAGGVDCAPVVPLVLVLYEVRYVGHVAGTTETCLLVLFFPLFMCVSCHVVPYVQPRLTKFLVLVWFLAPGRRASLTGEAASLLALHVHNDWSMLSSSSHALASHRAAGVIA